MKYLFLSILISTQSFAACNWSVDIRKTENGYEYSVDCHKDVGNLINSNKELRAAIDERKKEEQALQDAIKLKDLALAKSDERIQNFRDEAYSQYDRLQKHEKLSRMNDYLYFFGGVVVTGLAVWGAGQLKN